jgi:hypothetical protein
MKYREKKVRIAAMELRTLWGTQEPIGSSRVPQSPSGAILRLARGGSPMGAANPQCMEVRRCAREVTKPVDQMWPLTKAVYQLSRPT